MSDHELPSEEIGRLRAALKAGVEIVTAVTEWGGNCGGLPQTLQDRADWWRLDVDPALAPTRAKRKRIVWSDVVVDEGDEAP